ncbi:MAG: UDP-3-O-(3-hydroxymyristoyl)glucosamine N-acyltransferase [Janthinobacterium lividum]
MSPIGLTLKQIAQLTGASEPAKPNDDLRITKVAAFTVADANSVVFAGDQESLTAALKSFAGLILIKPGLAQRPDGRALEVADPRYAFALCARELARAKLSSDDTYLHPQAVIHPSARLGARVRVGAGSVLGAEVQVGDDSTIGPNVSIAEGVVLGMRVVVQAGAVLGSKGFGYVRHAETGEYLLFPQQGALVIEDDVEIGANTTIDRGALEETRIGKGTKIDNLVHVGHNCRVGKHVIIAAQVGISGSCVIEDGAVLAGQVGISDHCHIGPGVILGGQAGVYRGKTVIGPGEIFAGTPAERLRDQMRSLARLRRLR